MQEKRIQRARISVAHCSLGTAVRQLRVVRHISQETLGTRAGLHRNYVGAIERGEINPTFLTLLRLASGIEIPLSGLIVLTEEQEANHKASGLVGEAHD